jgi:hypothetical protein
MPPEGLNFVGVFGLKLREVSHGSSLQVLEESLPCAEGCKPCSLFSLAVTPSPKFDDKVIQFDGTHYSGETSHALAGTVDVSHLFVTIVRFGPPPRLLKICVRFFSGTQSRDRSLLFLWIRELLLLNLYLCNLVGFSTTSGPSSCFQFDNSNF